MEFVINYLTTHAGEIALFITVSNRLARATPTKWDNKVLDAGFGLAYKVFAIAGIKIPDIESVLGGKIKVAK